jgi:hypothetical protein
MRRVTSFDQLTALLDLPVDRGYAVGALPDDVFPADTVVWVEPITLEEARVLHAKQARRRGRDYTEGDGHRAVIAKCLRLDPEHWRLKPELDELPDGDERDRLLAEQREPQDPDTDRLTPIWNGPDELLDYGDPMTDGSIACGLVSLVQSANGLVITAPPAPAVGGLEACLERAKHRGRWVQGLFRQDPEAALWVQPYDEATRAKAQEWAKVELGRDHVTVEIGAMKPLVAEVVRERPGGPPLMGLDLAGRLPYGAARALAYVATMLVFDAEIGGGRGAVQFRSHEAAGAAATAGSGRPDLVDCGAPAPAAE